MKHFLLVLILSSFSFFNISYSQSSTKIKTITFNQDKQKVTLVFNSIVSEFDNGSLNISITPTSADSLDVLFNRTCANDGRHQFDVVNKSNIIEFINKIGKTSVKPDIELAYMGLSHLYNNYSGDKKDDSILTVFSDKILEVDEPDKYKTIKYNQNQSNNPYKVSKLYLSVFKVKMVNNSDNPISFANDFIIQNGTVEYSPISTDDLEQLFSIEGNLNTNKVENLMVYNLNEVTVIPPHSTIVKYFSTLPIGYNAKKLNIYSSNLKTNFNWNILADVKKEVLNTEYYDFNINWRFDGYTYDTRKIALVFCVVSDNEHAYFYDNNRILIQKDYLSRPIKYSFIIVYDKNVYTYMNYQLTADNYLNIEKGKTKEISISLYSITKDK